MSAPIRGPFGSSKCGCTIGKLEHILSIDCCDLHGAAAEILEALKALVAFRDPGSIQDQRSDVRLRLEAEDALERARAALAATAPNGEK